ncbi:hypothetical protein [Kribbella sp. CA-293567]|uniref:hypothetical protein n=1 Tax=Kribbella sp. CA-293567 TaxID=3002436 RepID=UPI0022DD55DC|nr:hypothetical protein [Kribbella sp. CA-293567]WBQ05833.1 hypothetical protein OX958_03305 [Kribbella sp. CA-293567]
MPEARADALQYPQMPSTPPPVSALTAWVDESIVVGNQHFLGAYTLASVITDPAKEDDLRDAVRALREKKLVRLHWAMESAKRRDLIVHAIGELGVAAIVALGSPVHRQKQERARRCCLECLLYELERFGVDQAWFETRAAVQDRRDLRLVDSAREKGLISRQLSVGFAQPTQEPLLWLPDAVAGAVTAAQMGEPRWLLTLSESVGIYPVAVR